MLTLSLRLLPKRAEVSVLAASTLLMTMHGPPLHRFPARRPAAASTAEESLPCHQSASHALPLPFPGAVCAPQGSLLGQQPRPAVAPRLRRPRAALQCLHQRCPDHGAGFSCGVVSRAVAAHLQALERLP